MNDIPAAKAPPKKWVIVFGHIGRILARLPWFLLACLLMAPAMLLNIPLGGRLDGFIELMIEDWLF